MLNLALNLAFMAPLQHLGPALASSISSWFNVAALAIVLHRRGQMVWDEPLRRRVPRMLAAGVLMAALLLAVRANRCYPCFAASHYPGMRIIGLALLVAAGVAAYGAWRPVARRVRRARSRAAACCAGGAARPRPPRADVPAWHQG